MSPNSRTRLMELHTELAEIDANYANWHKVEEWYTKTRPLIERFFPDQSGHFDKLTKNPFTFSILELKERACGLRSHNSSSPANDDRALKAKAKLLSLLDGIYQATAGIDEKTNTMDGDQQIGENDPLSENVFVVHGHDEEMKQSVARTLEKLGLTPIILHEQPDSGKTIIEKLERDADVGFAVVLLSPDDIGYLKVEGAKDKGAKQAKPRARQNVILELGYFVGRLGRDKVMALKRGDDLDVPNDLSGVVYTHFDAHDSWKSKLVKELKAAGYKVSADDL